MNNNKHVILNSNCVPVKGAIRATICDLQVGKFFYVPNTLVDILELGRSFTVDEIYTEFGADGKNTLDDYYRFVTEKGLAIETGIPDQFPKMSTKWSHPGEISNSIIDFREEFFDTINYKAILNELNDIGCSSIQFRSFSKFDKKRISYLLELVCNSRIHDLKFVIPDHVFSYEELCSFIKNNARISEIVVFGASEDREESLSGASLLYTKKSSLSPQSCGAVCASSFSVNIPHYTEANNYNSCLNKKISVDEIGNIKSCPSSSRIFGSVFEDTLKSVLQRGEVKKMWDITKDQIEVCKDCEFRYMCIDCRVFTEDAASLFAKPKKCSYDPYKAIWLDDEKLVSLQYESAG